MAVFSRFFTLKLLEGAISGPFGAFAAVFPRVDGVFGASGGPASGRLRLCTRGLRHHVHFPGAVQ